MANDKQEFIKLTEKQLELETQIRSEIEKGAKANTEWIEEKKNELKLNKDKLKPLQEQQKLEDKINQLTETRNKYLKESNDYFRKGIDKLQQQHKAQDLITKSADIYKNGTEEQKKILDEINTVESEALKVLSDKNASEYDREEALKEVAKIQEKITNLDKSHIKGVLARRNELLKDEIELIGAAAEAEKQKNQYLVKSVKGVELTVDGLKGAIKAAHGFKLALMANPLLAIAAAALAIGTYIYKAVTATRDLSSEMNISLATATKITAITKTMPLFSEAMKAIGGDVEATATAIFNATKSTRDVTRENVKFMTKLAATSGASEENIASMARLFADMNGLTFKDGLELVAGVNDLAKANMVDSGTVMNDLAASAEDFAAYTDSSMKNMTMAAIQAAKMGTSLATTVKMADTLLDFETSITSAMEASMMIGRNINLDRARMLAMDNDMVGMTNEIVKQLGSAAEFTKLNAIQRKKLASSLGVQVDELSRLIAGKPLEMTPEQKAVKLQQTHIGAMEELIDATKGLTRAYKKDKRQPTNSAVMQSSQNAVAAQNPAYNMDAGLAKAAQQ